METMYVFGGYILTGGKLQNGNPWQGVNVMLGEVKADGKGGYNAPVVARVFKASRLDSLMSVIQSLQYGDFVHAYFSAPDNDGKSKLIQLVPANG